MSRLFSALLLTTLALISGCDTGGGGQQPSPPAVSLQVGPLEDGSTVNLGIGQTLAVAVPNTHSSNSSVLQPAGSLPGHPEFKVFRGLLPGEAQVTGEIKSDCPPNARCAAWVREFRIAVVVGPSTPASPQGLITEMSEQTTYTMKVGETVDVALRALPGYTDWQNLSSTDRSILMPVPNPAAAAARGVTIGRFKALGPGAAQITATSGIACSPGLACPQLARQFVVYVHVTP